MVVSGQLRSPRAQAEDVNVFRRSDAGLAGRGVYLPGYWIVDSRAMKTKAPERGANGRQPMRSGCIRKLVAVASRGSRLPLGFDAVLTHIDGA
jgi:hypothetical protein